MHVYIYIYIYLCRLLHKQLLSIISCRNTDVVMVRPWMRWKLYALVPRTLSWFGTWVLWNTYALVTLTLSWFSHRCFRNRTRSCNGRYHGSAMVAFGLKKPGLLNRLYPYMYTYVYMFFIYGHTGILKIRSLKHIFSTRQSGVYFFGGSGFGCRCRVYYTKVPQTL